MTVGLIITTKRDDEWRRKILLSNGSSINSCSLGVSVRRVRRYQRGIRIIFSSIRFSFQKYSHWKCNIIQCSWRICHAIQKFYLRMWIVAKNQIYKITFYITSSRILHQVHFTIIDMYTLRLYQINQEEFEDTKGGH